jgi:hypothetical protein
VAYSKKELLERVVDICKANPPKIVEVNGLVTWCRGSDGSIIEKPMDGIKLSWIHKNTNEKTGEVWVNSSSATITDGQIIGGICVYPEDDPSDVCASAARTCDTPEKIEKFLTGDFPYWTGNEVEK